LNTKKQWAENEDEIRAEGSDSISFTYMEQNVTVKCSSMTANCSLCTDTDGQAKCTECQKGYVLVGYTCMSCSDKFPDGNCSECNSNGCTACDGDNVHVGVDGKCIKCVDEEEIFNTTSRTCMGCNILYSRCSKCNADMCTSCEDVTYIHNETTGACETCSELHGTGCTSCNSSHCTDCIDNGCCNEGEKIITVPGSSYPTCGTCSDFDKNCTNCSATTCTKCKDGMFIDNGTCVTCGELFAECGLCDADKCTQCLDTNETKWILTPDGFIPNDTAPVSSSSHTSQPVIGHPSSSVKEGGSNVGMIVGIVVGCVVLIVIVAIAIYCFATRNRKHKKMNNDFEEDDTFISMSVL